MEQKLKMRRRDFLKAVGLAALPVALGRSATRLLAFKAPSKRYWLGEIGGKEIEYSQEVRGICTYCSVGCGIIFYKMGGKVIHLEGDPDNPLNEGKLCAKGVASIQLFGTENPRRLKTPMIRVNPKPPVEELRKARSQKELREIMEKYRPVWKPVSWDEAFRFIAERMKRIMDVYEKKGEWGPKHDDGYYYKGKLFPMMIIAGAKLLNEEGYLIRKIAALLGSNNIDHDARRCHSTTVAGLAGTVGFGAQTQSFIDTQFISVYLIFGGNPAENHPVSMMHTLRGREKGTLTLIVADPKYGRTASKADIFAFFRPGTDIAFLLYILHYAFHERSPPVDQLDTFKEMVERLNIDLAEVDEIKKIAEEYDAETVSKITGTPVEKLREIARLYVENSGVTTGWKKFASIQWAMGQTQHHIGTQITRMSTILQLTLGNMGFPGGGLNPYRGHSNVQGTTDMCILAHILPGYIKLPPSTKHVRAYQEWKIKGFPDAFHWRPSKQTCETLGLIYESCDENDDNCTITVNSTAILWTWWFQNWRRFELTWGVFVGTDPEDKPWDPASTVISDLPFGAGYTENTWWQGTLFDGVVRAMFLMGENIAVSNATALSVYLALASLDLLVVVDIFETESAWFADVLLPAAFQYEKYGSITNSNRWLQWQDRVVQPPGMARADLWIMLKLWEYLREYKVSELPSEVYGKHRERVIIRNPYKPGEAVELYTRTIRVFMEYTTGRYSDPDYRDVDPELIYKEIDLAVDLYNGMYDWVAHRNLSKRRYNFLRTSDQIDGELDNTYLMYKNWGWSWPKNVRILYNLWTLQKTLGKTRTYRASGIYSRVKGAVTETITGETGEIRDPLTGEWRPAFIPGHNFFIGKFYKRAWSGMTDLFTGAEDPWKLLYEEAVVGKFVVFRPDGTYEVKTLKDMGVKCPLCESFYYDPEVVLMGKAVYKKPYFKGEKTIGGKTIKYVGWFDWLKVRDKFTAELESCTAAKPLKDCVVELKERYGEWYAYPGEDGKIWAWDMRYPIHYEPVESPLKELAVKYPAMAWRRAENYRLIRPPSGWEMISGWFAITPEELQKPEDALPVVLTANRLEEHFHTGQMTRNLSYLAELFPEPFIEIPKELAEKLGIKSGDIVELGSNRFRIYVRAMVTGRLPKLRINGSEVYVANIPWHWGWSGGHRTYAVANTITAIFMDTVTTMQESKACLAWVRKATPEDYDYTELNR